MRSSGVWTVLMGDTSCGGAAPKESFGATQYGLSRPDRTAQAFGARQTGLSESPGRIICGHPRNMLLETPFRERSVLYQHLRLPARVERQDRADMAD